jgi:hypothetical protein
VQVLQYCTKKPTIRSSPTRRNYCKGERWTANGHIERMYYAGSSLTWARGLFDSLVQREPDIRLTIRQRARVLQKWPKD